MARIAFIGLGHMGGGMAPNLAKAGHDVRAFDLVPEAVEKATGAGCLSASSAADAVKDADVVIWSGDPFDIMSRVEAAYIGGREVYRYDYERRVGVFAEP